MLKKQLDKTAEECKHRFTANKKKEYKPDDNCIGSPYFIFSDAKNEKQRIKKSIEKNKYLQIKPIGNPGIEYEFRKRERDKEIQPDMKFSIKHAIKLKQNSRSNASSVKRLQQNFTCKKMHFKSAFDLIFQKKSKAVQNESCTQQKASLVSKKFHMFYHSHCKTFATFCLPVYICSILL